MAHRLIGGVCFFFCTHEMVVFSFSDPTILMGHGSLSNIFTGSKWSISMRGLAISAPFFPSKAITAPRLAGLRAWAAKFWSRNRPKPSPKGPFQWGVLLRASVSLANVSGWFHVLLPGLFLPASEKLYDLVGHHQDWCSLWFFPLKLNQKRESTPNRKHLDMFQGSRGQGVSPWGSGSAWGFSMNGDVVSNRSFSHA